MQDGIYRFGGDRQCRAGHLEFRDRLVRGREANGVLYSGVLAAAAALQIVLSGTEAALAQKSGGILTVYNFDNPPSLSIHEELTYATLVPMMGVSNNLVMYKQDEPRNSLQSIVPDLATDWWWSEDGTQLTFRPVARPVE